MVSARALACRRCGKKQRINPKLGLLLLAGLFLGGMFVVASVAGQLQLGRWKDRLSSRPSGVAQAAVAAPVHDGLDHVTAAELWGQYNLDAARADARFKNKMIAVTGRVVDVRADYLGNVLLRLATGDPLETVRVTVVNRDDSGRTLPVKGQTVSLRCVGHGRLIGAPLLGGCAPL